MDYTLCPAAQPSWQAGSSRGPEGLGAPAGTPYRSIHYHSVASLHGVGGAGGIDTLIKATGAPAVLPTFMQIDCVGLSAWVSVLQRLRNGFFFHPLFGENNKSLSD